MKQLFLNDVILNFSNRNGIKKKLMSAKSKLDISNFVLSKLIPIAVWGIFVITIYNYFGTPKINKLSGNWTPWAFTLWGVLPTGTSSIFEMLVTPQYGITPFWVSKALRRDGFNFDHQADVFKTKYVFALISTNFF